MKKEPISFCVFIKNNNQGAFGLWESMASYIELADEFVVMDLGSIDGTLDILKDISTHNNKVKLIESDFPVNPKTGNVDAGSFAVLANECISHCKHDLVFYYQADEIMHENLLKQLSERLNDHADNLSFWRYQLAENFQEMKWLPHIVHRIGRKDNFVFVDDGMNTSEVMSVELLGIDAGWFTRWGAEFSKGRKYRTDGEGNPYIYGDHFRTIEDGDYPWKIPTDGMILDISNRGGFLDNIKAKAESHAPYWGQDSKMINVDGKFFDMKMWYEEQKNNTNWTATETKFDIPEIMLPLLGETTYPVRQDLIERIKNG